MIELPASFESVAEIPAPFAIVVKWSLLLTIAWVLHGLARQANPRWRVLLWRAVAVGLLLIPVYHAIAPAAIEVKSLAAEVVLVDSSVGHDDVAVLSAIAAVDSSAATPVANSTILMTPSTRDVGRTIVNFAAIGCAIIVVGILAGLLRLTVGWLRMRKLLRDSQPVNERVASTLAQIADDLGVGGSIAVRVSSCCPAPTLCGIVQPVLLIPERLQRESRADELRGVFAHELAHVRAHDLRWNCAIHAISSVLWFHPLTWFVRSAHASACEAVSDAVAANYLGSVAEYTRTLARVALDAYATPTLSLGMARSADVRRRIAMLERYLFASELRPVSIAAIWAATFALTLTIGGLNVVKADDQPPQTGEVAQADKVDDAKEQKSKHGLATLVTPQARQGIDKALGFLVSRQRGDGSVGGAGAGDYGIAITALCGIAWLREDSTPGTGKYGEPLERCLEYVLKQVQPSGMIGGDSELLYVHGYALKFLAEAHIARPDQQTKQAIARAVDLIVKCQNDRDGWRYRPTSKDADSSATSCLLVALLAARRAGATVPQQTIDRAIGYLKSCQVNDGGFAYTAHAPAKSTLSGSAVAMAAILAAEPDDEEMVMRGVGYLKQHARTGQPTGHFYYGEYYLSMAMRHVGDDLFGSWYEHRRDQLLASQADDGSWAKIFVDVEYSTAMACIVLQTPGNEVERLKIE